MVMGKTDNAIAHVHTLPDGTQAEAHDLRGHLETVANDAAAFAETFGNRDWAWLAGIWHDLGKYKPAFQKYIREQGDYEHLELTEGSTDKQHAIVGALHAMVRFIEAYGEAGEPQGRILAYLIAGHHTGLPDWNHEMGIGGSLSVKLKDGEHLTDALAGQPPTSILRSPLPETVCRAADPKNHIHFWVRFLFSCLVDADFLDTERYMDVYKTGLRSKSLPDLVRLREKFDRYMVEKAQQADPSPVNQLRQEILSQCRDHSAWAPGVFSLTVPTGGGKTLSGMAFALNHALKYQKRRIIVAIPYTSIIEQTAQQYREVFGDNAVLEHHSSLDPDRQSEQAKLATENWDAPIIVTTNVQLLESLFAARTSACRKLHNIVNSVIILDEAQMLPPEFLEPIVSALKALTETFGCSVVLSTATQPLLEGFTQSGKAILHGFEAGSVRELMDDRKELSRRLRRVELVVHPSGRDRVAWAALAEELSSEPQVLCIVNTRKDCRELFELMPQGTIHLSALMCPEHRSQVVARIKGQLQKGEPTRVVSTQLVEAGVDFDFPLVYRALAGLDSIAQAAGRCNREGRLNQIGRLGKTVVFQPPRDAPFGLLRKGQEAGEEIMRLHPDLVATLDPEVFELYFRTFFDKVNSFDAKGIQTLLTKDAMDGKIQFRTAANRFSLIDDTGQTPVLVWYTREFTEARPEISGRELVRELEKIGPNRTLMRRLQRFTVSVPDRAVRLLVDQGVLRPVVGQDRLHTQTDLVTSGNQINIYDDTFGLRMEGPLLGAADFIS